jgi:hypothetical protein
MLTSVGTIRIKRAPQKPATAPKYAIGENTARGVGRLPGECARPAGRRAANGEGKRAAHTQAMRRAENSPHKDQRQLDHECVSSVGAS